MTPQERLALALQYQKQRDLGSTLPSTPAENAARPVQEPEQSWLDKLNEAASGVGYGLGQQVEGLGQMARHPLDTLHSLAVGAGKAMDNPSAAVQAAWEGLKQSAGEAVSSPFNLGQAVGANVNINPRKIAAMLESPAVREITAYHGTPHRFEPTEANPLGEFDASKIGTGEGAQAYGHGIYLAESPGIAQSYADKFAITPNPIVQLDPGMSKKAAEYANNALKTRGYDSGAAAKALYESKPMLSSDEARKASSEAISAIKHGRARAIFKRDYPESFFYTADLPDEMIDRMLDWDKPLNEQPAAVQNIFGQLPRFQDSYVASKATAGEAYGELAGSLGSRQKASDALRQAGIPGIKYLDAGSRGQGGSGTRNFVVFPGEEKKVKILERK